MCDGVCFHTAYQSSNQKYAITEYIHSYTTGAELMTNPQEIPSVLAISRLLASLRQHRLGLLLPLPLCSILSHLAYSCAQVGYP